VRWVLSGARFIAALGIAALGALSLFVAALATFVWGAVATALTILSLLRTGGTDVHVLVSFIGILDIFLIGAALFIFAASLYELFIGQLAVPGWLVIKNIDQLKTKMTAILILAMGITFLEHLVDWQDAQGTELFAIGIALVSFVLVILYRSNKPE